MATAPVWAEPPTISQAVTPGMISYQGQVQTASGSDYVDGVYGIEFRLYDAATAGTLLWGARYNPYLKNGFFSVILGQTQVGETELADPMTYAGISNFWKAVWIDPNNAQKGRYLGITIVTEAGVDVATPHESFPRQQLLASPFAIQAQFAQQAAGETPVGGIIMWSGTIASIPSGWALCDGANGTPDLRGRFIVGYDGTHHDYNEIGKTGGADTVVLTEGQMPRHRHNLDLRMDTQVEQNQGHPGAMSYYNMEYDSRVSAYAGNNECHENRPPFYVLAYIMRVQ